MDNAKMDNRGVTQFFRKSNLKRILIYGALFFSILVFLVGLKPYRFSSDKFDVSKLTYGDLSNGRLTARIEGDEHGLFELKKGSPIKLHFILEAHERAVNVYEEWNSWGYFARSFTAVDKADPKIRYEISRTNGIWDYNFASTIKIKAGETLVTNINLLDGTWEIVPKPSTNKDLNLVLQGHFDLKQSNDGQIVNRLNLSMNGNSWLGHLDTNKIDFIVRKEVLKYFKESLPYVGKTQLQRVGSFNHTLLTVEALQRRKIKILGVVVNGYTGKGIAEQTNVKALKKLLRVPVYGPLKHDPRYPKDLDLLAQDMTKLGLPV